MAGYRLLRTLIKNPNSRSLQSLVSSASSTVFQSSSTPISSNFSSSSRFLSQMYSIFRSYVFIISSITVCHAFVFTWRICSSKKIEESLELNLNEKKSSSSELGVESTASVPRLVDAIDQKESRTNVDTNEGFINFPNMISMSRLISGPFLGWMIINEWYLPAFVGLAVSGATDWLDGYVARKMGINSVVGSYLDPLADKLGLLDLFCSRMLVSKVVHSTKEQVPWVGSGKVGPSLPTSMGPIGGRWNPSF